MNDNYTDLMSLFLKKFPEMKNLKIIKSPMHKVLRVFLNLNSYNVRLEREESAILLFKNLNTNNVSGARLNYSETKDCSSIDFYPDEINDGSAEAIAFSICNSHFTCVRINDIGMFIEKCSEYNKIKTEFYDHKAIDFICEFVYQIRNKPKNNGDKLKTLIDMIDFSADGLSSMINKKCQLSPDLLIEACSGNDYSNNLNVTFKKNGDIYDRASVEYLFEINFYAKYLSFMKEQGYYSDDNKNNLIRIRNK